MINNSGHCYTQCEVMLMNQLRKLWEQHVQWTRAFIISTAAELGDLAPVTARLMENPGDFAEVLAIFYGEKTADAFKELFTQHLQIAGDLVTAAKKGDTGAVEIIQRKWYANADQIAEFLSRINPYWEEEKWRSFFYSHLNMTEQEAVLRLSGQYAKDVKLYDQIEQEALQMADYMFWGIHKQFPEKSIT